VFLRELHYSQGYIQKLCRVKGYLQPDVVLFQSFHLLLELTILQLEAIHGSLQMNVITQDSVDLCLPLIIISLYSIDSILQLNTSSIEDLKICLQLEMRIGAALQSSKASIEAMIDRTEQSPEGIELCHSLCIASPKTNHLILQLGVSALKCMDPCLQLWVAVQLIRAIFAMLLTITTIFMLDAALVRNAAPESAISLTAKQGLRALFWIC